MSILHDIQQLQYHDIARAETLLKQFIADTFEVGVVDLALRPLAVSLNSFNGFVTLEDGRKLFFKSHVEPGGVIAEYYNSDLLLNAGYHVIRPVMASTEPGRQMLLYEVVEDQSVFDAAWAIECAPQKQAELAENVTSAQHTADDELFVAYQHSLRWGSAQENASSPVHQLFHHRLTQGRYETFYADDVFMTMPDGAEYTLARLKAMQWVINGVPYTDTLNDVVARAIMLLVPAQEGPAVVGHGDAHNGNVFLRGSSMVYFDPAFAGAHDPMLDLVKPFYHNVHAMWMYFPDEVEATRGAALLVEGNTLHVTFPEALPAHRMMFWESKTERVLVPLLRELKTKGWLRKDWRLYMKSALACCPLLTMNLADQERFPPSISLLGMAHVIETGGLSTHGRGRFDAWLDSVEQGL